MSRTRNRLPDRAVTHDTIIGCLEDREAQVAGGLVPRDFECPDRPFSLPALRLQQGNIRLCRGNIGVAGDEVGVGLVERDIGGIDVGGGASRLRFQLGRAALGDLRATHRCLQCHLLGLRLGKRGLCPYDLRVDGLQCKFLCINLRLSLVECVLVIAVVQCQQYVASLDLLVGNHVDLGHIAGNLGRDDRHVTADIGIVGRHHETSGRPPVIPVPAAADQRDHDDGRQNEAAALFAGFWRIDCRCSRGLSWRRVAASFGRCRLRLHSRVRLGRIGVCGFAYNACNIVLLNGRHVESTRFLRNLSNRTVRFS